MRHEFLEMATVNKVMSIPSGYQKSRCSIVESLEKDEKKQQIARFKTSLSSLVRCSILTSLGNGTIAGSDRPASSSGVWASPGTGPFHGGGTLFHRSVSLSMGMFTNHKWRYLLGYGRRNVGFWALKILENPSIHWFIAIDPIKIAIIDFLYGGFLKGGSPIQHAFQYYFMV